MIRWEPLLVAFAVLDACSPQPRSPDYFIAHPEESIRVVADCRRGAKRGQECVNAQAGVAAAQSAARMERYRRSF